MSSSCRRNIARHQLQTSCQNVCYAKCYNKMIQSGLGNLGNRKIQPVSYHSLEKPTTFLNHNQACNLCHKRPELTCKSAVHSINYALSQERVMSGAVQAVAERMPV